MSGDLAAGVLAGLAVAMPVGAIGGYLVGLAARERLSAAVAAALGVATVDGAYAVVASLGGIGLGSVLGQIARPLSMAASVVLVAVAVRTLQLAVRRYRRRPGVGPAPRLLTARRAYLTLIAMTAVNPATIVTFVAVVLGRGATGSSGGSGVAWFTAGAFGASAVWQLLLVGGGSALGRVLRGRRGQLAIAGASATIMLGLAVAVLFT